MNNNINDIKKLFKDNTICSPTIIHKDQSVFLLLFLLGN